MILLSILVVAAVLVVWIYNRLIKLRTQSEEAWSGIDVQLKRRYDLIPNLVETVKGYAAHEGATFERVIQARNQALNAGNIQDKAAAEGLLAGTLKNLFALSEAYPELKANQNFLGLQQSLTEIEDNVQLARRYYNAVVRDLNVACQSFPSSLLANFFGFKTKQFFEAAGAERESIKVQL